MSVNTEAFVRAHSHRVPDADAQEVLRRIRQGCLDLAVLLDTALAPSRERSLAQTKLEECRMWACNAATLGGSIPVPLSPTPPPQGASA